MRRYGPSPKPAGLAFGHPAARALAGRCLPGAMALRAAVEDGTIRLTDVAGAEIYATPAGATA